MKRVLPGLVALSLAGCATPAPPSFAGTPKAWAAGGHFTVIGDVQGTLLVEKLLLRREDNRRERARLLSEVARTNPEFVVLLGDLVAWGASNHDWEDFDQNTAALRRQGTPVFAVPGNHDYYGGDRLRRYFARLPHLGHRNWYERRYGALGMIFLDSNVQPLGARRWAEQQRWFRGALRRFDADPSVLGVLVFLHHSPLTNNDVVGDDEAVQQALVPEFLRAKKTLGMLSGHAHGYERFEQCGKAFVVSAGGGGPRPALPAQKRHQPEKFVGPPKRNFNFVELSVQRSGLRAVVVGLPKDGDSFCRMDSFDLPWAAHQVATGHSLDDALPSGREDLADCYPTPAEAQAPVTGSLSCPATAPSP